MRFLRGERKNDVVHSPSKFWERLLMDVYTKRLKLDQNYRIKIKSRFHKSTVFDSVLWFLLTHTNSYLVTDKIRVNDITEKYPELLGRVFDDFEFKYNFTKNRYYNQHSPSERKDSGRYQTDMFLFLDYSVNDSVMDKCGINRVLEIEYR